jgi:hypothetical protein
VGVRPLEPAGARESSVSGTPEQIATALGSFGEIGFTQVDLMLNPGTIAAVEALVPVVKALRELTRR